MAGQGALFLFCRVGAPLLLLPLPRGASPFPPPGGGPLPLSRPWGWGGTDYQHRVFMAWGHVGSSSVLLNRCLSSKKSNIISLDCCPARPRPIYPIRSTLIELDISGQAQQPQLVSCSCLVAERSFRTVVAICNCPLPSFVSFRNGNSR